MIGGFAILDTVAQKDLKIYLELYDIILKFKKMS